MYFTDCSAPISLALWNPILEWRATLNPASICCSCDFWRTKLLIDNGNKPKHFQKLFTQRLFQIRFLWHESKPRFFPWIKTHLFREETWQLNEFLLFPLERGTIRSTLKGSLLPYKIKDRRQFPSINDIHTLPFLSCGQALHFSFLYHLAAFFFSKLTVHWFSWSSASCMVPLFSLYIARSILDILSQVLSRGIPQSSFRVAEC